MITEIQKRTIKSIVRIFETGKAEGNYSAVARIKGDTGGISYGVSQASLNSGSLGKLLRDYAQRASLANKQLLAPYLDDEIRMASRLNTDDTFYQLLKTLGQDQVMHQVQDDFFDREYWQPAVAWCNKFGLVLPLSYGVIYDSKIHGSLDKVSNTVIALTPANGGEEKVWVTAYLKTRRDWLARKSPLLAKTVYRMNEFLTLIDQDNWQLDLPIRVRGINITK